MQRIGIYSGAFDPIHDGHVQFAIEAITRAELDRVYFLVEPRPRHKQGVKAFEHRVAMVQQAINSESKLGIIELQQARFYVHETWPVLQRRFANANLFMLMGSDVFARLSHWPRIDELVVSADFIVGLRDDGVAIHEHMQMIQKERHLALRYTTFASALPHENASNIRQTLRSGNIPKGINPAVMDYIIQNGLYSSENWE